MSRSNDELKKYILEYLENNRLMTLATSEKDIPWAATVFFAYDSDLNIYFISRPETRKTQHITTNPNVSLVVNHYQPKKGTVKGLQIEGKAEMLDKKRDKEQLSLYCKRFDWADNYLHDHELYKIIPKKIYYLDDELFGPGGQEELEL